MSQRILTDDGEWLDPHQVARNEAVARQSLIAGAGWFLAVPALVALTLVVLYVHYGPGWVKQDPATIVPRAELTREQEARKQAEARLAETTSEAETTRDQLQRSRRQAVGLAVQLSDLHRAHSLARKDTRFLIGRWERPPVISGPEQTIRVEGNPRPVTFTPTTKYELEITEGVAVATIAREEAPGATVTTTETFQGVFVQDEAVGTLTVYGGNLRSELGMMRFDQEGDKLFLDWPDKAPHALHLSGTWARVRAK